MEKINFPKLSYFLLQHLWSGLLVLLLLVSCTTTATVKQVVVTPIPDEFLPTIIAETISASIQLSAEPGQPSTTTAATTTAEVDATAASTLALPPEDEEPTGEPPSAIEALDVTAPAVVPELINEDFTPPTLAAEPALPPANIKIYKPGDLSRVVSPISVVANVPHGMDNQVQVELIGEDGQTLAESRLFVNQYAAKGSPNVLTEIKFKIPAVAEAGRLQFTLRDLYGRLSSISSVNLILLSSGYTELMGYGDLRENIVISQPSNGSTISGGRLLVSGVARTGDDQPLLIELIDQQGNVVGAGQAAQDQAIERNFFTYSGEVAYSVGEATPVRLVVHANGVRIPGTAFLTSLELVLQP